MPKKSQEPQDEGEVERLAKIGNEACEALSAETVTVKLIAGGEIVGSLVGLSLQKKGGKKGEASWSGSVKIQTDPGVLQIDCLTVESITPD